MHSVTSVPAIAGKEFLQAKEYVQFFFRHCLLLVNEVLYNCHLPSAFQSMYRGTATS